jgi:hypothetical protein
VKPGRRRRAGGDRRAAAGFPFAVVPALAAAVLGGCAGGAGHGSAVPIELEIPADLTVPAGRAHADFQRGRQVTAVNRYEPWCELEIETVSGEPQRVAPGRFPVGRVQQSFIRDYDTRFPALIAGFDCFDPVYKETFWWLAPAQASPVLYLRCLAPYVHCRIGPHLSARQIQNVLGTGVRVKAGVLP